MSTKIAKPISAAPASLQDKATHDHVHAILADLKPILDDRRGDPVEHADKLVALVGKHYPGEHAVGTRAWTILWAAGALRGTDSSLVGNSLNALQRVYQDIADGLPSAHENPPGGPLTVVPKLTPVDRNFWINYEG